MSVSTIARSCPLKSLPHVVDEAIKAAYKFKGVAVVTIPVDYGFAEIDEQEIATAKNHKTGVLQPDEEDLQAALPYFEQAKKPVLYIRTRSLWSF